jgi:hypothetical protein
MGNFLSMTVSDMFASYFIMANDLNEAGRVLNVAKNTSNVPGLVKAIEIKQKYPQPPQSPIPPLQP